VSASARRSPSCAATDFFFCPSLLQRKIFQPSRRIGHRDEFGRHSVAFGIVHRGDAKKNELDVGRRRDSQTWRRPTRRVSDSDSPHQGRGSPAGCRVIVIVVVVVGGGCGKDEKRVGVSIDERDRMPQANGGRQGTRQVSRR
jgi:hypothetical protein